jgi:hypothetical protein
MGDTHFTGLDTESLKINGTQVLADQQAAIADYTITWSANEPTAGDTNTIDDGDTVGNDNEGGQAIADLTAKVNAILAALRAHGIIAS